MKLLLMSTAAMLSLHPLCTSLLGRTAARASFSPPASVRAAFPGFGVRVFANAVRGLPHGLDMVLVDCFGEDPKKATLGIQNPETAQIIRKLACDNFHR